jgi:hypothetical protein
LHGYNTLTLDSQADPTLVGADPTLGWRVKAIKGHFVRGYLNGPSFVGLHDGRWLLGEVTNGVLHGPQLLKAVNQILPVIERKKIFIEYYMAIQITYF